MNNKGTNFRKMMQNIEEAINLPAENTEIIDISTLLQVLDQARILHWQTPHYAEHKALGCFYDSLSDLVDGFVESAMGNVGVPRETGGYTLNLRNYGEYDVGEYINDVIADFKSMKQTVPADLTDLQNIIDEMIGSATKTRYLLHLK